jgi:hypothetical protein
MLLHGPKSHLDAGNGRKDPAEDVTCNHGKGNPSQQFKEIISTRDQLETIPSSIIIFRNHTDTIHIQTDTTRIAYPVGIFLIRVPGGLRLLNMMWV